MVTLVFSGFFLLSVFGFLAIAYDKAQAIKRKWRVSEVFFFCLSACGGAFGVWLGMKMFRHKTMHLSFRIGIPILLAWNLFALYFVWETF
jgi:uncharacterized membrane protein YsdA (DUF1294 family)